MLGGILRELLDLILRLAGHSINTSKYKNGVYNCRFIIDGKIVDYQKLVIVK